MATLFDCKPARRLCQFGAWLPDHQFSSANGAPDLRAVSCGSEIRSGGSGLSGPLL